MTHSVWAAAVVALLIITVALTFRVPAAPLVALVVVVASVSHIAVDLTSVSRVAVLWPWVLVGSPPLGGP